MRRRLIRWVLALSATAAPAAAHHGWADYQAQEYEVSGIVQSVELGPPHGRLKVKVAGETWDVMLAPPAAIHRAGFRASMAPPGTRIIARGHRHSDPARLEMKTERLIVGSRSYDLYPSRP